MRGTQAEAKIKRDYGKTVRDLWKADLKLEGRRKAYENWKAETMTWRRASN